MGSSVITKVRVFAVRSPVMPGGLGYWVEETGYENVTPHTESSCVMAIGDRARILKRLFSLAAQFPSGSLQLRSGKGSAKHMLDKWLDELDNPWVYPEGASISLDCSGGWCSAITEATKPRVQEIMVAHGHHDIAELIEQGQKRIEVDLSKTFPALAEMTVKRDGDADDINLSQEPPYVLAWKIIREGCRVKASTDAYKKEHKPTGKPIERVQPLQFFSMSIQEGAAPELFTVLQPDQSMTTPEPMWCIEGKAISNFWSMERDAPGQHRECFKALKLSIEQTKPLPPDATITCSMELVLAKPWLNSAHRKVTQELQIAEESFTVTYEQVLRKLSVNGMYNLLRTLSETLKIELPPPKVKKAEEHQQELLFA